MDDFQLMEHRLSHHTPANSWWLTDVKGIPVARVCDDCEGVVKAKYKPEIFGEGEDSYEDVVEETIEED